MKISKVNYMRLSSKTLNKIRNYFDNYPPTLYKKKDLILHAKETQDYVYFIKRGFLRAYKISEDGEELTLIILRPDDFFPITLGLNDYTNNYYLESLTTLELIKVPHESFMNFLKDNPDVYFDVTNNTLLRLDSILTRMEHLITGKASTKIATTLLICASRFGEKHGEDIILTIPLTHKDIATLVGITRETTSLEMKKLENKGLLSHQGKYIVIKNIKLLEAKSIFNLEENDLLQNSL